MTAQTTVAGALEPTPLADYLAGVLSRVRPLARVCLKLGQSYGSMLAAPVHAPTDLPAFDQATVDGYAVRSEDVAGAAAQHPVRLTVVGDLTASSSGPARLAPGTCVSVAAGAPLPPGADTVVPPGRAEQGMAAIELGEQPRRGQGLRRAGAEIRAGAPLACTGAYLTPALVAVLAATGVDRVMVGPSPRVAVISTGDELVAAGQVSRPGRVVDANSYSFVAAAVEAGAHAYHAGACADDPVALRALLQEQTDRADLIVTSGGTGSGPGDVLRRTLGRDGMVAFTGVSLFLCTWLGFGLLRTGAPVICLPGDPGAALVGFEVLARPVIQKLAGAEPFRPNVRAHLLETIASPLGLREFRPAYVCERRGGGYTARPLAGGPYTLSGMALANGMIVLGERIGAAAAGSTVDVLLLDRRR